MGCASQTQQSAVYAFDDRRAKLDVIQPSLLEEEEHTRSLA